MYDEPSESCGLGPRLRIAFVSEHLRHILSVDEDIGHWSIVDILAVCTLWKAFSVTPDLVTQQVLLFVNPTVPDLLGGGEWMTSQRRLERQINGSWNLYQFKTPPGWAFTLVLGWPGRQVRFAGLTYVTPGGFVGRRGPV